MTYNYLLGVCVALFLFSCGGKKAGQQSAVCDTVADVPVFPIHVPFEEAMDSEEREIKLSDIADSVNYIPLETNSKCLISSLCGNNLIRTSKYLILPWIDRLFQYTLDGKFVRTIGRKGQGPGEFNYIAQVDVSEKAGRIYMLAIEGKMNIYDLETGKFVQGLKVPHFEATAMAMYNDTTVVTFVENANGQEKTQLYVTTLAGDTLKLYYRNDEFVIDNGYSYAYGGSEDREVFKYDGQVCCKDYYTDTLYTVSPEKMEARYIFDLGKYSLPLEYRYAALKGDEKRYNQLAAPYIRYAVLETERYLFLPYLHWAGKEARKPRLAMYDKKSGECFRVKDDMIRDDLTGGMFVYFPHGSFDDRTLVVALPASLFFEEAEENPAVLNHPQLKGLREDDNPVLMVVTLKK